MSTDSLFPAGTEAILPILPLRNSVLFPASVVPVNVGRARSVRLIEEACNQDRPAIGVVAQRRPETEDPGFDEFYAMGTIARVLKVIRLSSGNYSVVLQGVSRMRIVEPLDRSPYLKARVERIHEPPVVDPTLEALSITLRRATDELSQHLPPPSRTATSSLENVKEPGALADLVAASLPIGNDLKQAILETLEVRRRIEKVLEQVSRQSEVFKVKKEISTMVEEEMHRSQRELLLRQQLKSIRRELGESDEEEEELDALREKIARHELPIDASKAAKRELKRMSAMSASSAEYQVARTYVEWLADLPWSKTTPDRLDVTEARRVLDEDHFGLERPKKRILEYVAIRKLRKDGRAPILCFVGPPGVGKTSLAKSIARAAGRQFVRVSLGGVADEAEIRGHRRTYVGSFPGRIINALKKAGSKNPVIVLDEVDKLGKDHRGDPASALLEVLDPEQNDTFTDHYIEVPFDLSQVMFIATANRKDTIPGPLLDRMEVIDLPGYTREEKRSIAREFLVPKQLSEHGLSPDRLDFSDTAIAHMVDEYTHEAGVRRLEQMTASVCRAVAVRLAAGEDVQIVAEPPFIEEVLGPPKKSQQMPERKARPGVATGVVWSPAGGELMLVEATRMPGSGKLQMTGRMGDIMKESVATAFSFIRAHASELGLADDFLSKIDVHVHLPQGAVPKEGPSSGLTFFVALASMLTRIKARVDTAVTGEITLRGNVLKVTGIKEKCLAAHRAGLKHVVMPKDNAPDLEEVPKEILADLHIHFVSKADEVLALTLEPDSPTLAASSHA
ncbi:MAG: endopeptidase La [Polyangiales bacterium]